MGILDAPKAPQATTKQKQVRLASVTRSSAISAFSALVRTYNATLASFWENPDGLTPQEAFDAMGKDAGDVVGKAVQLQQLLNAMVPGSVSASPPPKPLTINADGTVTVGD